MSDSAPAVLSATPDPEQAAYTGKECAFPDCTIRLPAKGESPDYYPTRKYCELHKPVDSKKKPKADKVSVNIDLGASKGGKSVEDKRVAAVTKGATQMAQTLGTMIAIGGDTTCGNAIIAGAGAWGEALGNLSRYQPVLAKIFAPSGEVTGQGLAWIAAIAATAGIAMPVLAHHNLIKPELAARFAGGMATAGQMAEAVPNVPATP